MSCDRWIDLLVDHSANEPDDKETILLEQHLADCAECRSEELRMSRILAPEDHRSEDPRNVYRPAPQMERRIWAQWRLERGFATGSERRRSFRLSLPFTRRVPAYLAAAAVLAAALAGLWAGQRSADPSQGARTLPTSHPERFTPLEDSREPVAFATTPTDAISLSIATPRDTL